MGYFALLTRDYINNIETIGNLQLFSEDKEVFNCVTLELPWKNNKKEVSCIPEGEYNISHRWSDKYGHHYHVKNVEGRSYILIHYGNFYTSTKGCILVGESFYDIDNDGNKDITNSRKTISDFVHAVPKNKEFQLKIISV